MWSLPRESYYYVVSLDPAEGNVTSDDSALCVMDELGEQVAEGRGKFSPTTLASYAHKLANWYNKAGVMPERNNHGHVIVAWWETEGKGIRILKGHDDKPGWNSNRPGKVALYDSTADAFRQGDTVLRSFATFSQLSSIDGNELRGPEGQRDDLADAYALCVAALPQAKRPAFKVHIW